MKGGVLYLVACIVTIALLGAIAWSFLDGASRHAMLLSGGLVVGVQMLAFVMARLLLRKNAMLGWGLGSVLRLLTLVVYAVVLAKASRSLLTPALLSFVGFLFVTTVIEPLFL
ncbi:MAG: hypothetical protein ACREOK_14255, partial [Gemmatimonadaceae bacterium]